MQQNNQYQAQNNSITSLSELGNPRHQQSSQQSLLNNQNVNRNKIYRSISSINVDNIRRNVIQVKYNQNIKFVVQPQRQRERSYTEMHSYVKIPQLRQKVYLPESGCKSLTFIRGDSAQNCRDSSQNCRYSAQNCRDSTQNCRDCQSQKDINFNQRQQFAAKFQEKQIDLVNIYGQNNNGLPQNSQYVSKQNFLYQKPINQPYIKPEHQLQQNAYKDLRANLSSQRSQKYEQLSSASNQNLYSARTQPSNNIEFMSNYNNNLNQSTHYNIQKRTSSVEKLPSIHQTQSSSPKKTKATFYDEYDDFNNHAKSSSSQGSRQVLKDLKEQKQLTDAEKVVEKQKRRIKMFKTASLVVTKPAYVVDQYTTVTGGQDDAKIDQGSPQFSKFDYDSVQSQNIPASPDLQTRLPMINDNQFSLSPIQPINNAKIVQNTAVQADFQTYAKIDDQKQNGEDGKNDQSNLENAKQQNQFDKKGQKKDQQHYISPEYQILEKEEYEHLNDDKSKENLDINSQGSPSKKKIQLNSKISNLQGVSALSKIVQDRDSFISKAQKHKYIDPLEDVNLELSPDGVFSNLTLTQDKEIINARAYYKKTGKGYDLQLKRISSLDNVFPEKDVKRIIDIKINHDINEQYLDFRGESIIRVARLDEYEMEKQFNSIVLERETKGKGQFLPRNAYIYRHFIIEQFDRFYFLQDQIGSYVVQKEALSEHQFKSMMLNLLDIILSKKITKISHDNVVFCVADQKFYCMDRLYNQVPMDETTEQNDPYQRYQNQQSEIQDGATEQKNYQILQDLIDLIIQIKFQTFSRNQIRQQQQIQSIKSPFVTYLIKEFQTAKSQQEYILQQQRMGNSQAKEINVFTQLENIRKNIFKHHLEAHDVIKRDGDIFSYHILMKPRRFREFIDMLYYGSDIYVDQNILANDSEVDDIYQRDSLGVEEKSKGSDSPNHSQSSFSQYDSSIKSASNLKDAIKKTQKKSLQEILFDQARSKRDNIKIIEYGNNIFPKRQITKSNLDRLYAYIEAKLEQKDYNDINFYMSKFVQICSEENPSSQKYARIQLQLAQFNFVTDTSLSATILICIYVEKKFQNLEKFDLEKSFEYNKLMSELSEKTKIEDFEITFLKDNCNLLQNSENIELYSQSLHKVGKWYLHQDKLEASLIYLYESIKVSQDDKFKQYCTKIIQNVETSLKKFKLLSSSQNLQKNTKEAYDFYSKKNIGEVQTRLENISKELGDVYHLKERKVIDIFYLTAKEQIKYDETASKGGNNFDLFQGYANSSGIYSQEELNNCSIEIQGIYGDLYVKEKRYLEALLEYFSKLTHINNNTHDEYESTLWKIAQIIFELNYGEYLYSILNCMNSNTKIYKAIEVLHLLSKSIVIFNEVESNQYSSASTHYNSTYLLNKALVQIEQAKQIGQNNSLVKLKVQLKILDVEYQIIQKLGDPQVIQQRIENVKQRFEQKMTNEEQFLLFQEYINIYLIDSSPVFDVNFFSKCEKAAEMAIKYQFYSHGIKDIEICLNLKVELSVNDISNEVKSVLQILEKITDEDQINKCLDIISNKLDNIEDDNQLLQFILKFIELSNQKEKVVNLVAQNFNFIYKMYKESFDQQIIDILCKKTHLYGQQQANSECLALNAQILELLQLNELQNSNLICKINLFSIKLSYLENKSEQEILNLCESFFGHLVNLSKQPKLKQNAFAQIKQLINQIISEKVNIFKSYFKNYLQQNKITNTYLLELTK
ncbi:hypothetical protein TTHERM_00086870 (macronuclear) [Tetrahymena thermophila SB210]|uniref:Uncharacterized protein n=1 Tax=Tetrahymena thermophila (strain SB210) TaxID=312017 RepID=Q236L0_TETTS|nr:hypothetical protein TTHERM_00086870 [Tetrahymena thermophila SB210]EAR92490.2 hypothetical protein TTHERM_00086870 [Tetrahymena thermophila SB210]|eukprot:XP_001012735.2 hypothetical protein TTHERM_00086870 [Tetrahymena thermophila SB210]